MKKFKIAASATVVSGGGFIISSEFNIESAMIVSFLVFIASLLISAAALGEAKA